MSKTEIPQSAIHNPQFTIHNPKFAVEAAFMAQQTMSDARLPALAWDGRTVSIDAAGELVYLVGSREASLACDPWFVPVDHAIIGIVDHWDMEPSGR